MTADVSRNVVFVSKATPGDDEFVLWLAPRLEAQGYRVFADIVALQAGDRWRREITTTLQERAAKMLLCCSDATLAKDGVQEEIGIAADLARELRDPRFIVPLRLAPFKKLFGIGELQHIDFSRGWAIGLDKLLSALKRQKVPRDLANARIDPLWEIYRRRGSVPIKKEPERLTSNWLRVSEVPDHITYFVPSGSTERIGMWNTLKRSRYPAEPFSEGFLSFGTEEEIGSEFEDIGRFEVRRTFPLTLFIEEGATEYGLRKQDASRMAVSMFRKAWETMCRDRGLLEYRYSKAVGFHASKEQLRLGQRIPWGKQGERRSAMLRNVAMGHVWQLGVTGTPAFWPFPHFRLKSRVLFAPPKGDDADSPYDDHKKQHRLRRTVCKGWRNKQWHGRLMAFIEMLSNDSPYIRLPLGASANVTLEAVPVLFTSPISTVLPDALDDEQEERDETTLGRPETEEPSE